MRFWALKIENIQNLHFAFSDRSQIFACQQNLILKYFCLCGMGFLIGSAFYMTYFVLHANVFFLIPVPLFLLFLVFLTLHS